LLLILFARFTRASFAKISFQHHAFFYCIIPFGVGGNKLRNLSIMKKLFAFFIFLMTQMCVYAGDGRPGDWGQHTGSSGWLWATFIIGVILYFIFRDKKK
jgi:hypothetical protein